MRYALGAGLSGLIFSFFNPEYKVIGIKESIDSFVEDIIVKIQATKENRVLLEALGFSCVKKTVKIEYLIDGKLKSVLSHEEKIRLVAAKLAGLETDACHYANKKIFIAEEEKEMKHESEIFSISISELKQKLEEKVKDRIIYERIIKISPEQIMTENNTFSYEKIVSTLPAPIFWKLWGEDKELHYTPLFYSIFLGNESEKKISYQLSKDTLERVFSEKGVEIIERNYHTEGSIPMKFGRLSFSLDNLPPSENILFLGRFAEWNPTVRMDSVISKCINRLPLEQIWNEQKRFNKNFVDFSELNDLSKKQIATKEYVLHMFAQTYQLLDKINWKFYKQKTEINYNQISEQLIDVYKYWLSICLIWGITPEEFVKNFKEKSRVNEKRKREGWFK